MATMNLAEMMESDPDIDTTESEPGFITVDTPTTEIPSTPDLACVVCGTALTYGGRGPKPKYCEAHKKGGANKNLGGGGSRAKSGGKDVDAAVAALDQMYNLLEMGLMFAGAHSARKTLRESIEDSGSGDDRRRGLRSQNRDYLTADPDLARRIAQIGKTGGRYAFFAAQAATLGPVAILAFSEISIRRAEKRAERPDLFDNVNPENGTNLFGAPIE